MNLEQDWKQKNEGESTKIDYVCLRVYVHMYVPVCIYVCVQACDSCVPVYVLTYT